ncbi:hypothetical protein TBK1r_58660 [Stieleria magnilauensis]|uniref:Uncharacterized protein n=1 Tax=Stieleria magnilauensis TaxID=2527963 RepID=A0ABX5XZZ1_9BACT|nr:hypothetical protein TBK1r_58660 [Planctomycetes bacterium TBK1r]
MLGGDGALRGTPERQAGAGFLNPLAAGRQRFDTAAVLISCGPLSDPQAHDSPVTRVVWLKGVVLLLKDDSIQSHDASIVASRAALDAGSDDGLELAAPPSGNAVKHLFPAFFEVLAAGRKPSGPSSFLKYRRARALPLKKCFAALPSGVVGGRGRVVRRWRCALGLTTSFYNLHCVNAAEHRLEVVPASPNRLPSRWVIGFAVLMTAESRQCIEEIVN